MEMTRALELDSLARGALRERFDNAILQVLDNIMDPNTPDKAKRSITITLSMVPDEAREMVAVVANVSTKLAPRKAVSTVLMVGHNAATGEVEAKELAPGSNPGQHSLPTEKPKTADEIAAELKAAGVSVLSTARAAAGGE